MIKSFGYRIYTIIVKQITNHIQICDVFESLRFVGLVSIKMNFERLSQSFSVTISQEQGLHGSRAATVDIRDLFILEFLKNSFHVANWFEKMKSFYIKIWLQKHHQRQTHNIPPGCKERFGSHIRVPPLSYQILDTDPKQKFRHHLHHN
eukprot:416529_1